METMHPAGRRTLPPVPRTSPEPLRDAVLAVEPESDALTERFVVDLSTGEQHRVDRPSADSPQAPAAHPAPGPAPRPARPPVAPDGEIAPRRAAGSAEDRLAPAGDQAPPAEDRPAPAGDDAELDAAQQFVARLRAATAELAAAAGAESAVVREAVPPARHRRARCRLVLRYADESQVDVTFLGPAGRPGVPSRHGFDRQIRRWLQAGQRREAAWLVTDPDAPDGLAVDLSAWIAAA